MFLIAWLVIILIVSVLPLSGPDIGMPIDKIEHFILYGVTSIFLFRHFKTGTTRKRAAYKAIVFSAAYGFAMECLQYFIPQRSFSPEDAVANTAGALLFCTVYMKLRKH
ncbi:MAG: VanZ family protein [Nitrospirota bacterium]|nr:VanZ family protein [Nitrospirota bacterium]